MNKKFLKKAFLAIIIVALLIAFSPEAIQSVTAHNVENISESSQSLKKCYALDIIFLIDQSNSMSGTATSPANDKFGNRTEAYKIAVEWLAQNQYSMCQDAIHRVGVISFGSETEVDLEMKNIPSDHDAWESIRASIKDVLTPKEMGNTDHALAFTAAKEMLERNPAPESSIPRKTAIVMVTDGMPCVPGRACDAGPAMQTYLDLLEEQVAEDFPFSEALFDREAAIQKQVEIYGDFNQIPTEVMSDLLAEYDIDDDKDLNNSTYIYILALNDSYAYLDEVGGTFSSIAQTHGGELINLANNTSAIPLQFNEVLSRLAMIKIAKGSCGQFYMNPYTSSMTFNVYRNAEDIPISISHNGHFLEEGKGDTQYFGMVDYQPYGATNESYEFVIPKAGEWIIESTVCEELHVVYQTFLPDDIQFITPDHALPLYDVPGAEFNPDSPFYLAYTIQGTTPFGNVVEMVPDADYPAEIKVEIEKPDQSVNVTSLQYDSTTMQWVSDQPVPVDLVGEYKVAIVSASTECVDPDVCQAGAPFEIFGEGIKVGEAIYEVTDVDHFSFAIVAPKAEETLPLHGSLIKDKYTEQPIPVSIQLRDEKGQLLSYKDVFGNNAAAEQAFTASLSLAGQSFSSIDFKVDPKDDTVLSGSFEVDDVNLKDEGTITVELKGDYLYDKYLTTETTASVDFIRKDPLIRNTYILIGIAVLIALIIIGVMVWFIYHRNRSITGYLEFTPTANEGRALKVSIAKKWDKNVVAFPPQLMVGKATIKNDDGKSTQISITYKVNGKEETMLVKDKQNKSMAGGIPYQVCYHGATVAGKDRPTGPGVRPGPRPEPRPSKPPIHGKSRRFTR